jgi:hypothetical protein
MLKILLNLYKIKAIIISLSTLSDISLKFSYSVINGYLIDIRVCEFSAFLRLKKIKNWLIKNYKKKIKLRQQFLNSFLIIKKQSTFTFKKCQERSKFL